MAEMKEAKAEKRSYKKLSHMEIEPVKGENGGHIVKHHYHNEGVTYKAPEVHMFGKEEGPALLAHMTKHLKISEKHEPAAEEAKETPAEEKAEVEA